MINLTGRWVGKTRGKKGRLHYWLLVQEGKRLAIYTRWEGESQLRFYENCILKNDTFTLRTKQKDFLIKIKYDTIFSIPEWDCEEQDGVLIPTNTVVFSRRDTGIKGLLIQISVGILIFVERLMRLLGLRGSIASPLLLLK